MKHQPVSNRLPSLDGWRAVSILNAILQIAEAIQEYLISLHYARHLPLKSAKNRTCLAGCCVDNL